MPDPFDPPVDASRTRDPLAVKRAVVVAVAAVGAVATLVGWLAGAQPVAIVDAPIDRLPCVSYAPFRKPGQSPLVTGAQASAAQIDADLAALARITRCVRTYSVDQGLDAGPAPRAQARPARAARSLDRPRRGRE